MSKPALWAAAGAIAVASGIIAILTLSSSVDTTEPSSADFMGNIDSDDKDSVIPKMGQDNSNDGARTSDGSVSQPENAPHQ